MKNIIIGNGLLANAFSEIEEMSLKIFASGVSNSSETDKNEFEREFNLLKKNLESLNNELFIYFSTISIKDKSNHYIEHKKKCEQYIEQYVLLYGKKYLIFRLPQIIGIGGNSNNLFNFLISNILEKKTIPIWKNSFRSLMDIEDVVFIISFYIKKYPTNRIVNILGIEELPILKIVNIISEYLNIIPELELINKGSKCILNNSPEIDSIINNIDKKNYTKRIIEKYAKHYRGNSPRTIL